MELQSRIHSLADKMGNSKHYLNKNYYRIKKENDVTYKIASIKSDPCGASLFNPQLTVVFQDKTKEIIRIDSYNDFQTPIETISYSKENALFLKDVLTQLVDEIEHAFDQNYS